MLDNRPQRQRGDEGQGADDDHHTDQHDYEQWRVRWQRTQASRDELFAAQ